MPLFRQSDQPGRRDKTRAVSAGLPPVFVITSAYILWFGQPNRNAVAKYLWRGKALQN